MPDRIPPSPPATQSDVHAEIARLNKIIQSLMNRAERNASMQGSDFNLFQTAITLEDQVRSRTGQLEAALQENEKINRALRESESHYRLLIENAPVSIHEIDLKGRITSISKAGLLMHGAKEEGEVRGTSYLDGVSAADRERIAELLAQAYAGAVRHFEFNASILPGQAYKSCFIPIKDKNGRVEKLMGITEDITERKQAQQELEIKNTILLTQQEVSPDAILVIDDIGKIISFNQQFISVWKLLPQMVREGPFEHLLQAAVAQVDNPQAFLDEVQYLNQHRHEKRHTEIRLKDGRIFDGYSAPISGADGKYYGRVWYTRDITERKKTEELIWIQAFNDALTHLPNRRLLHNRLKQAMAASKRSGLYGAVMFLDLDNFKPLNDKHGHDVGDLLLIEVAHRITACVRAIDTVARFGGDEFVVMLSEFDVDKAHSAKQARDVAEKIRLALAQPYFLKRVQDGKLETTVEHHCTASIGVALFVNHNNCEEDILKFADQAMYQAKESGRNKVHFFEANLSPEG